MVFLYRNESLAERSVDFVYIVVTGILLQSEFEN